MIMGIRDIFSKRKRRREQAGKVEPYKYDDLPGPLRMQVQHLWSTAIGVAKAPDPFSAPYDPVPVSNEIWFNIHQTLAREYGRGALGQKGEPYDRCVAHIMSADVDGALDIIEESFRAIDTVIRVQADGLLAYGAISQHPDDAIAELNERFKEHAVGYQFVNGEVVRVDSELLHAEVVVPALTLLRDEGFEGAEDEFMTAHDHYRNGRVEECITEALKAFESTMKTICSRRKWAHEPGANASQLINVLFTNNLVPEFLRTHFAGVRQALEAGVPTLRNKQGGHGQGEQERQVPAFFAGHILHLTAANILLLVEANRALRT